MKTYPKSLVYSLLFILIILSFIIGHKVGEKTGKGGLGILIAFIVSIGGAIALYKAMPITPDKSIA